MIEVDDPKLFMRHLRIKVIILIIVMFSITSWNCRSVRNKFHILKMSPFKESNILAFQETFLKPNLNFTVKGKTIYRSDRMNRTGGGLLTAVDRSLPSQVIDSSNIRSGDCEALIIKIHINNKDLTIANIYIPPDNLDVNWLERILNSIHRPFVIVGDFNVRHTSLGSSTNSSHAEDFFDWLMENDICPLNMSTPTHFRIDQEPSLIDYNIASPDILQDCSYYVHPDTFGSDHSPIITKLEDICVSPQKHTRSRIIWSGFFHSLREEFKNSDIQSAEELTRVSKRVLEENRRWQVFPERKYPPYWNSECSFLLGRKRKTWREAKKNNDRKLWLEHKRIASKLHQLLTDLSRSFWNRLVVEAQTTRDIFNIIKQVHKKKNLDQNSNLVIHSNNNEIVAPLDQANIFADFYKSTVIPQVIPNDLSIYADDEYSSPFKLYEIEEAIKKCRETTPGPDQIPAKVFKNLSLEGLQALLGIINKSWSEGVVPDIWKTSTVIPILKPDKSPSSVSSYRPISLTCIASKIMERMVLRRLMPKVMSSKRLHINHHGFLPRRGCDSVLSMLHHNIVSARSNDKFIACVTVDIKKAYDCVWIDGLIYKLSRFKIGGNAAKWIQDFCNDRTSKVRWRRNFSRSYSVVRGVPQGAVLSPFLFMIFLSDLYQVIPESVQCFIYADDIILMYASESWERIHLKLQVTIHKIESWCRTWHMSIDHGKSSVINFSSKREKPGFRLSVNNQPLDWSNNIRILGIFFSKNLNFRYHFEQKKKAALTKLNALKSIAGVHWGTRTHNLIRIVDSTIIASLNYGCHITIAACKTDRAFLEVPYRAALRTATGLHRGTGIPLLLQEAGKSSLTNLQDKLALNMFFRNMSYNSPCSTLWKEIKFNRMSRNKPLMISANEWLDKNQINLQNLIVAPKNYLYLENRVIVTIDALPFQDKKIPSQFIPTIFEDYRKSVCNNYKIIFTDASKQVNGTAFAIIAQNKVFAGRLLDFCSIFTAEALAILHAIEKCCVTTDSFKIFSDSLSVLSAIKSMTTKSPPIIFNIIAACNKSLNICRSIELIWTPAHAGIEGNERADLEAKKAVNSPLIIEQYSDRDISNLIAKEFNMKKNTDWNNSKYARNFAHMGIDNYYKIRKLALRNRQEDTLVSRIRTRTYPTNKILFRWKRSPTNLCQCGDTDTIDHILLTCPLHDLSREALRAKLGIGAISFSFLLNLDSIEKINYLMEFLNATGRF